VRRVLCTLFMAGLAIGLPSPGLSSAQTGDSGNAGAVFVMTNAVDKNEVIAYRHASNGQLQEADRFATRGRGSGGNNGPLESQGSLTLSQDHTLLFAVNAASGSVSVFSSGSVVSFRLDHGKLTQIPNSTCFLTTNNSGAGGLAFSPDGRFLVVVERLTNDCGAKLAVDRGRTAN
jgi:6-phosphogluconolactonase